MIIAKNAKKTNQIIKRVKENAQLVGFVPTMGALHQGHLSLIKKAGTENDFLAVSIFVNPLQFRPGEDFKKYPRNLSADKKLLQNHGVDLLFYPQSGFYPAGFSTYVNETKLSQVLCGKLRPGHFRGVCTVVAKLFNVINPDQAYFGQKDYQQALIIQKMAKELNFNLKIKIAPTIRDKDKVALSSRNHYLTKKERQESRAIYQALALGKKMIKKGEKKPETIIKAMKKTFRNKPTVSLDYIEIRSADNLQNLKKIKGKVFIGIAAYFGKTRLVDNVIVGAKK